VAYCDLNSEKFFYLLAKGTHEGELKRFFAESKMLLMLKQAKVQNLPYGRMERIRTICDRLPRSTDDIVRNWFQKNVTMAEPIPVDDVLSDLLLYEEMNEPIPEKDGKQLARSALVHLFASEPSSSLIAFLKRRAGGVVGPENQSQPPGLGGANGEQVNGDFEMPAEVSVADEGSSQRLSDLLAAVIIGEETAIDEALAPYTESVQTMVDALISARGGDMDGAASLAKTLSPDSHEYKLLQRALNQARHRPSSTSVAPPGVRVMVPQPLMDQPGLEEFDIVGVCSNEADKVVFVRPLGLVVGNQIYLLSGEDRPRFFPESGDVMSFRAAGRRLPHQGDIVRWVVAEREQAGGKTRFHYVDEPCPMVEVINVPFASSAPDEVRHYIKDLMAVRKVVTLPYPLFALTDGVTIAAPKSTDPRRDEAYEQPWNSWGTLETWLLEGRRFSMGIPQTPASQLDLSSLDAAFKKLVKSIVEEQKATITKTQVRDLAALIRSQSKGEVKLRSERVANALDRVVLDAESLETLFPVLISREEVQRRVDAIVEGHVEEKLKDRVGLTTELEVLRGKTEDLQRESKELERRIKKQTADVAASVRQAFSRAIEDGVASLAQVEIFRVLSAPTNRSKQSAVVDEVEQSLELRFKQGPLSRDEGISRLVALGVKRRHAVVLALLTQLMAKAGGGLVIRGNDARQLVRVLGQIDSAVSGYLEIPMGLTSGVPIRRALATAQQDMETIVVLDADLSPIEVYGSSLLDGQFDAVMDDNSTKARLLFSCTGGDMALPLPSSIRRVAVVIDLDSSWDQQERLLSELEEDDIPLLKSVFASLANEVDKLQGAERNLVESVLTTALQMPN
jgi:hypothetical protein